MAELVIPVVALVLVAVLSLLAWRAARTARERRDGERILNDGFPATFRTGATRHPTHVRYLEFTCSVPEAEWRIRIAGHEWQSHVPPWRNVPTRLASLPDHAVFATDSRVAEELLAPGHGYLVKWIDRLHSGGILVDIGGGRLLVRDTHRRAERPREQEFIDHAYRLAAHVRESLGSPSGITIVEVNQPPAPAASGTCLVCGTAMVERRVECASCRTPHHRECFEYNGECATYACGGASVDGPSEPPPPPRGPTRTLPVEGLPFPATLRTGTTLDARPLRFVEFNCGVPGGGPSLRVVGQSWHGHTPPWAPQPMPLPGWWEYGIFCADPRHADRLLRAPALQLVRDLDRLHTGGVLLELHAGRLHIRDTTRLVEPDRTAPFVRHASALAALLRDRLTQRAPQPEVTIVAETPAREAICQVCGTVMRASRVECRRCRTPHHRECWDFNGRCSTYGCGSARFAGEPEPRVRDRRHSHGVCPACDTIVRIDPQRCPTCGAVHHVACWNHRRGCSACAIARR